MLRLIVFYSSSHTCTEYGIPVKENRFWPSTRPQIVPQPVWVSMYFPPSTYLQFICFSMNIMYILYKMFIVHLKVKMFIWHPKPFPNLNWLILLKFVNINSASLNISTLINALRKHSCTLIKSSDVKNIL